MTIKVTMLLQDATNVDFPNQPLHRVGGWSESWYYTGTNLGAAIAAATGTGTFPAFTGLMPTRASLLPKGSAVIGARFQIVDPLGLSQSIANTFPGTFPDSTNAPQVALLCKAPGVGVRNIRRVILRALPYSQLTEGEYQPQPQFTFVLNNFIAQLGAWLFRGRDLSQPTNAVITISSAGVVTTVAGLTYNVNDMVRVLKSRDASGNLRGGRFQVSAVGPGPNVVTLSNWTFGPTTGGSIRKDAVVYPVVDFQNFSIGRAIVRKVGRPFVAFRGRRARRR